LASHCIRVSKAIDWYFVALPYLNIGWLVWVEGNLLVLCDSAVSTMHPHNSFCFFSSAFGWRRRAFSDLSTLINRIRHTTNHTTIAYLYFRQEMFCSLRMCIRVDTQLDRETACWRGAIERNKGANHIARTHVQLKVPCMKNCRR
jgi:hypothetical protein